MKRYISVLLALLCLLFSACDTTEPANTDTASSSAASAGTEEVEIPILSDKETHEMNRSNPFYTALLEKVADRETPITWLFIGDSITANDGNSAEEFSNYPEIFQKYLINGLLRPHDRVINTAVSGWRIANCSYEASVAPYSPDVVFLNIGTNDSFASDTDAAAFRGKVEAFLDQVKTGGAIPVVIASGSFSDNWGDVNQKTNFLTRYFDTIYAAAESRETLFVDLFHAYEQDRAFASLHYFCSDTVHPSRAGFLFIAQTLIRQLGLANEKSPILMQDPAVIYQAEPLSGRLTAEIDLSAYIQTSSDIRLLRRFFPRGFTMAGGASAIGQSQSYITRRTLSQLLMSNLKDGKTSLLPGSLSEIEAMLAEVDAEKILFLYPEDTADTGEALISLLDAAGEKGISVVLITPPGQDTLAEAMRTAAKEREMTLIDLNAYFAALAETDRSYHGTLFDENGVLNYAGAVEAAMLIAEAFGLDSSLYSVNSFKEEFYPQSWGIQGAGSFYYYYRAKATGKLTELSYIPLDSSFTTKGKFSIEGKSISLFAGQSVFHVLPQYDIVKVFKAPADGMAKVTVQMKSHSTENELFLTVKNGEEAVTVDGKEKIGFTTNAGAYKTVTFDVELKKDTFLYFILSADTAQQGYILENITYY